MAHQKALPGTKKKWWLPVCYQKELIYHQIDLCYVSVTMSTWSPSPNIIIIIITPIPRRYSCLSSSSPSDYLDISPCQSPSYSQGYTTPSSYHSEFILLRAHYYWHILCQQYLVIVGGYHLGLFTQNLDLQLVFQGMGMHRMIFYFYHTLQAFAH